jgi:hypothetical protein
MMGEETMHIAPIRRWGYNLYKIILPVIINQSPELVYTNL